MKLQEYTNMSLIVFASLVLGGCASIPIEIESSTSTKSHDPVNSSETAPHPVPEKPERNITFGPRSSDKTVGEETSTHAADTGAKAESATDAHEGDQIVVVPAEPPAAETHAPQIEEKSRGFSFAIGPWGSAPHEPADEHSDNEMIAVVTATGQMGEADHDDVSDVIELPDAPSQGAIAHPELMVVERTMKKDVEATTEALGNYLVMVRPGDYLGKIALREYDDLRQWKNIYDWNKAEIGENPNVIHPYRELTLYKPQNEIPLRPYDYIIHTASNGESLWSIAKDWYGDNLAWVVVYSDNESTLSTSGGRLVTGMELKIRTVLIEGTPQEIQFSANGD